MYRMNDDDDEEQLSPQRAQGVSAGTSFPLDDEPSQLDTAGSIYAQHGSSSASASAGTSRARRSGVIAGAGASSGWDADKDSAGPSSSSYLYTDTDTGTGPGTSKRPNAPLDELDALSPPAEITRLMRAWMEERSAPALLYWRGEIVDVVVDQIEQQVAILDSLLSDSDTSQEEHLRLSLVQLDIERARWLLKAYLRTRLRKIETYARYLASSPELQVRLSDIEKGYLKKYDELQTAHLHASVLSFLPEELRSLTDEATTGQQSMVVRPDLDEPAFVRCRIDCGTLRLPDGERVELAKGSIHLLRYSSVQYLVEQGRLEML